MELVSEGPPREVRVTYRPTEGGEETSEVFNTVLFGVGRDPDMGGLGLEKAGVKTDAKLVGRETLLVEPCYFR